MCLEGLLKVSGRCPEGGVSKVSDYLTVEYFESSWNLENLELECGLAQLDLFFLKYVKETLI